MFPILNLLRYFMEDNQVLIMACLILYSINRSYIIIYDADDDMEEGIAEVECACHQSVGNFSGILIQASIPVGEASSLKDFNFHWHLS